MKITFPHIGDAHLVAGLFLREIGVELITPPLNTQKGLEEGSILSPDEICLPFKLMITNLMEAHRLGADTVVMPATMGPCRLGEYGELLKCILDKKGYYFDWIIIDSPYAIGMGGLMKRLGRIVESSNRQLPFILRALHKTNQLLCQLEALEKDAHLCCGYEQEKGSSKALLRECKNEIARASSLSAAIRVVKAFQGQLSHLPVNREKSPLKLVLAGEIYSLIEPFGNHHLEELLMDMGVSFEKNITLGWWVRMNVTYPIGGIFKWRKGNGYLSHNVGGYARETVAEAINCKKKYDGVIQIFPVGCMPEIVAKAVLSDVSQDMDIRVLSVIYDEMGGEAGYITRVEAFVDMLLRKKRREQQLAGRQEKKGKKRANVLFGN